MVQFGSEITECRGCKLRRVCGLFFVLNPVFKFAMCAACLEHAAAGVRAAESREPVQPAQTA